MNLGEAIKLCRTRRGLTQTELAERSGVSVSYLSMLEQNKRDPSLKTIEKIAGGIGLPASLLILIAADPRELEPVDRTIAEKVSHLVLTLLREKRNGQQTLL